MADRLPLYHKAGILVWNGTEWVPASADVDGILNVNASVSVSGADGAILDGVSSSIKATVLDYTSSNPLAVRLTDTNGDYTAAGAGTQYTEDAAAAANPVGNAQILIRTDTPATQVNTDGDNVAQRGTNYGAAYVQVVTSSGSYVDSFGGGTQYTEDAAAAANPVGNALILVREDARAGGLTSTDGDNVAARGNDKGELYVKHTDSIEVFTEEQLDYDSGAGTVAVSLVGIALPGSGGPVAGGTTTNPIQIADAGGNISIDDGGNTITVDGTVAVTNAGLTELAAAINGSSQLDVNIAAQAAAITVDGSGVTQPVSHGALTELAAAINASSQVDVNIAASGATVPISHAALTELAAAIDTEVQVDVVGALPAGNNNIGDVDVASVVPGTGATNLGKAEDGAHTSGDVGVMALAVRRDTPNAAIADTNADYIPLAASSTGALRVAPISEDFAALANGPQVKKYYTNAGAATDGIIWSPAAGTRWYVTDIFINVSAAATVTLEDDLAGGDSPVWKAELAANSGWSHSFHTPLFSGEDAADLIITTSAGNVYVMVTGYEI